MARRIGEQTHETAALVLLAEIHRADGSLEPARSACEAALAITSRLGLRAFQVHCHRQLGELLTGTGQSRAAREHLVEALTLYREMGMQRWVDDTAALVARLEGG